MSRRSVVALLWALGIAAPATASAQEAERWRDSSAHLARRLQALRDSMLQGDSTVTEVARQGDLVIGASETLRGSARAVLERFAEARARWFGGASPGPQGFRIVLNEELRGYDASGGHQTGTIMLAGLPDSGASARTQRNVRRGQSSDVLIDVFAELMYASAGPEVVRWLDLTPPLSMDEKERRAIAMYAVVTGTGSAQRGCVAGNFDDCEHALGLLPGRTPQTRGTYPPFVRSDLLLSALEIGGPGAWHRFRNARDLHLKSALAAAAAIPADSLLARWRTELLARRPTAAPIGERDALLALAWTGVVLLGALGASRWA